MHRFTFLLEVDLSELHPLEILGNPDSKGDFGHFVATSGIASLGQVLSIAGILSAAIVIACSLLLLVVVNYPKTKAQVKERIANSLIAVALIAALPYLADVIYSIILSMFR